MKAAIYCRVSSEEQLEGFSMAAQLNALNKYCIDNGIEIYNTYMDEGVSAKYSDENKRPGFNSMIKDAEKGLFNIILVHKFDRFARNVELSQSIKNRMKKANINVVSITEPLEDSPMGFLMGGLHDLFAEYYIRNLAQESKKGHVERARQGYHNGSVPYGYKRSDNNMMVINEEQAKVVRMIFDMYVYKGYGSTKIANILNDMHIPSAVNGQWAHFTVNRVLKNVKYIGKILYDDNIYDGSHEPIIDIETFNQVNSYMKDRTWKREPRGANFEKFMLLGLLKCGECGKVFRVLNAKNSTKGKRITSFYYYMCNNASHMDAKNRCTNKIYLNTTKFEAEIIKYIEDVSNGLQQTNDIVKPLDLGEIIEDQKKKINAELARAKKAYLAEVFSLEEYKETKERLEKELKELSKPIKSTPKTDSKELQNKIKSVWDKFLLAETPAEKRSILKTFIEHIYVYKDRIRVRFSLS